MIQIADAPGFPLDTFTAKVSVRQTALNEFWSDLLERLSSSCLSVTVDLSSRSHNSTLMRWEFLMTIGTSSNIFSKPMLAFFKLAPNSERGEKRN